MCAVHINQQTPVCGSVAQDGVVHPVSGSCLLNLNSVWIGDREGEDWGGLVLLPGVAKVIQLLPKAMCSHANFICNLSLWVE